MEDLVILQGDSTPLRHHHPTSYQGSMGTRIGLKAGDVCSSTEEISQQRNSITTRQGRMVAWNSPPLAWLETKTPVEGASERSRHDGKGEPTPDCVEQTKDHLRAKSLRVIRMMGDHLRTKRLKVIRMMES
ncbi:hypothetical protein YC2023_098156 [Brassica napus]